MEKIYYSYNDIHHQCISLAKNIINEYQPDIILAISGGGLIPARIMRNIIERPIVSITVKYYNDNNEIMNTPILIQSIDSKILENKKILIVDEVDDTRQTLDFVLHHIKNINIKQICVAVLHNKNKPKKYNPDNFENVKIFTSMDIDDKWIVYPRDEC